MKKGRVPTTIYGIDGSVLGMVMEDGTLMQASSTQVGEPAVSWNEVTAKKEVIGVVAWDGSAPPVNALGSKGELLGDYAEIRRIWQRLGIVGPRFKTATWGPRTVEQEA